MNSRLAIQSSALGQQREHACLFQVLLAGQPARNPAHHLPISLHRVAPSAKLSVAEGAQTDVHPFAGVQRRKRPARDRTPWLEWEDSNSEMPARAKYELCT